MAANELDPAHGSVIPDTDFDTYPLEQLAAIGLGLTVWVIPGTFGAITKGLFLAWSAWAGVRWWVARG